MDEPVVGFNPVSKRAAWKENFGAVMIPQPQLMVKKDQAANPNHYQSQPLSEISLVSIPKLFAYFPECQRTFLNFDPKFFLIRYKRKHKRRAGNRQNNVWVHPANHSGSQSGSRFHGGAHKDVFGNSMPTRTTEWDIPVDTKPFESIELFGFDIEKWYGINAAGASQVSKLPVTENTWWNDPDTFSLTGQNMSRNRIHRLKELRFRIAISIRDPFSQDSRDRLMGPMSDVFKVMPVIGIFQEGNCYYKWRIKI